MSVVFGFMYANNNLVFTLLEGKIRSVTIVIDDQTTL